MNINAFLASQNIAATEYYSVQKFPYCHTAVNTGIQTQLYKLVCFNKDINGSLTVGFEYWLELDQTGEFITFDLGNAPFTSLEPGLCKTDGLGAWHTAYIATNPLAGSYAVGDIIYRVEYVDPQGNTSFYWVNASNGYTDITSTVLPADLENNDKYQGAPVNLGAGNISGFKLPAGSVDPTTISGTNVCGLRVRNYTDTTVTLTFTGGTAIDILPSETQSFNLQDFGNTFSEFPDFTFAGITAATTGTFYWTVGKGA